MEYTVSDARLCAATFIPFVNRIWRGDYDLQKTQEALERTINITAYDGDQLVGADGYASKYPIEEYCLRPSQVDSNDVPNHENLNAHGSVPADVKKALMDKYKHPIHKELEETAKKVGGHGGMDFIMDYRLAYCLQNGLPLDMDVYDLAEWCCMAELTRLSIENNSAPVEIPDFTRGGWNKVQGYHHAFVK